MFNLVVGLNSRDVIYTYILCILRFVYACALLSVYTYAYNIISVYVIRPTFPLLFCRSSCCDYCNNIIVAFKQQRDRGKTANAHGNRGIYYYTVVIAAAEQTERATRNGSKLCFLSWVRAAHSNAIHYCSSIKVTMLRTLVFFFLRFLYFFFFARPIWNFTLNRQSLTEHHAPHNHRIIG